MVSIEIGSSSMRAPKGARASSTARVTAGGAIMRPPSPPPFTPCAVYGEGVWRNATSIRGTSGAPGTTYSS